GILKIADLLQDDAVPIDRRMDHPVARIRLPERMIAKLIDHAHHRVEPLEGLLRIALDPPIEHRRAGATTRRERLWCRDRRGLRFSHLPSPLARRRRSRSLPSGPTSVA